MSTNTHNNNDNTNNSGNAATSQCECIQPLNVPNPPPILEDERVTDFDYNIAKIDANYKPSGYQPIKCLRIQPEGRYEYKFMCYTSGDLDKMPSSRKPIHFRNFGITQEVAKSIEDKFYEDAFRKKEKEYFFNKVYSDDSTSEYEDSVLKWCPFYETFYWTRPESTEWTQEKIERYHKELNKNLGPCELPNLPLFEFYEL